MLKQFSSPKSGTPEREELDAIITASINSANHYLSKLNKQPNQYLCPYFYSSVQTPNSKDSKKKIKENPVSESNYTFNSAELYPTKENYVFFPKQMSVTRASKYALGQGVLGRTWTATGYIEILDSLYGQNFEEVLLHEILYNIYPEDSEQMIREKTKRRLWFDPRWH